VAEKSGFQLGLDSPQLCELRRFAENIANEATAKGEESKASVALPS
jgi:hypothetical protein